MTAAMRAHGAVAGVVLAATAAIAQAAPPPPAPPRADPQRDASQAHARQIEQEQAPQEHDQVPLKSGPVSASSTRYDRASGRCTGEGVQLLAAAGLERLIAQWNGGRDGVACTAPQQRTLPAGADYPKWFAELALTGSAQVLVLLEADGSVAEVHPVCATDEAFADAATRTARQLPFAPATCDGAAARAAFLLPFQYDAPPPPVPTPTRTAGLQR